MPLPTGTWWRDLTPEQLRHVHEIEEWWGAYALGEAPATNGYTPRLLTPDRGRLRVALPKYHPYAYSAGWQWRARLVVMEALGRTLHASEQVHHEDLDRANDHPSNLELVTVAYHGQLHASAVTIAGFRDDLGRFVEVDTPEGEYWISRWGPILGGAAADLLSAAGGGRR